MRNWSTCGVLLGAVLVFLAVVLSAHWASSHRSSPFVAEQPSLWRRLGRHRHGHSDPGSRSHDSAGVAQKYLEPIIHLVYSINEYDGKELDNQFHLVYRSAWSAFQKGCDTQLCRANLHVHVYCNKFTKRHRDMFYTLQWHGLFIDIHHVDVDDVVARKSQVREEHAAKL